MELCAPRHCPARASIVESHIDRGLGPVATLIVRKGTLKIGDCVVMGTEYGKVRSMRDSGGKALPEVGPGQHALVSGLRGLPSSGDEVVVVSGEEVAARIARARGARAEEYRRAQLAKAQWEAARRRRAEASGEYERRREMRARLKELTTQRKKHKSDAIKQQWAGGWVGG